MSQGDRLVWIDCEMTGLDLSVDELVEIAVVITDYDLSPVDEGLDLVIAPSPTARAHMNEFVTTMHTQSGLIDELDGGLPVIEAQQRVLDYVKQHVPNPASAPMAGNSIGTDRAFIAKYMPEVDGYLHYRNIDVSSIKELMRHWFPRVYFNAPEKQGGHRALADILESIRELGYYRRAAFIAEPGPTTDQLQTVSNQVTDRFATLLGSAGGPSATQPPAGRAGAQPLDTASVSRLK